MADKRLKRLTTTEVAEMTRDDFEEMIKDCDKCGRCSECLLQDIFLRENITLNGVACDKNCSGFLKYTILPFFMDIYFNKQDAILTSDETPTESSNLSYSQTINFMKNRGYDHCYMCGKKFEGSDT